MPGAPKVLGSTSPILVFKVKHQYQNGLHFGWWSKKTQQRRRLSNLQFLMKTNKGKVSRVFSITRM